MLKRNAQSFEALATKSNNVVTVTGTSYPEPLPVEIVSPGYLTMMRAPMILGTDFNESEAASHSVVIGHDPLQRRFSGNNNVLGSTLQLNGVNLTVIGIADRGFNGVSGLAQAWIPATVAPLITYPDHLKTNQNFITATGRLRSGATLDCKAELAVLGPRIHQEQPSEVDTPQDQFSATAMSLNDARIDVVTRRAMMLLTASAAMLLLIACANVAGLLIGRAASGGARSRSGWRSARDADVWCAKCWSKVGLIAAAAGALTLIVTAWVMPLLRIPATLARGRNFYGAVGEFATPILDWRLFAFTFAICACTVLLCALLPALRSTRTSIVGDLKKRRRAVRRPLDGASRNDGRPSGGTRGHAAGRLRPAAEQLRAHSPDAARIRS